jgi:hypothetical protein
MPETETQARVQIHYPVVAIASSLSPMHFVGDGCNMLTTNAKAEIGFTMAIHRVLPSIAGEPS